MYVYLAETTVSLQKCVRAVPFYISLFPSIRLLEPAGLVLCSLKRLWGHQLLDGSVPEKWMS